MRCNSDGLKMGGEEKEGISNHSQGFDFIQFSRWWCVGCVEKTEKQV